MEMEWKEAQKTVINVDLVAAAKRQLKFLAAVDRNRWLYEGPALEMAIYRYNFYWLPLLAKHSESPLFEGPLVVPLDCEWVWHCHRLNPVRYKSDCEELYGTILDNHNVVSSVEGTSKEETEQAVAQVVAVDVETTSAVGLVAVVVAVVVVVVETWLRMEAQPVVEEAVVVVVVEAVVVVVVVVEAVVVVVVVALSWLLEVMLKQLHA